MDILALSGVTHAEIEASLARERASRTPMHEVCICGHSARGHSEHALATNVIHRSFREAGQSRCTPGRMTCPCTTYRGVIKADSVRGFLFKTTGSYANHALYKGIYNAQVKGLNPEPLTSWVCDFCGSADRTGPVPVNRYGQESDQPEEKNFLVCADHYQALRAGTLFQKV